MSLCTLIDSPHVWAGQEVIHLPLEGITECFKLNAWDKHTSLLLLSDLSVAKCVAEYEGGILQHTVNSLISTVWLLRFNPHTGRM